MSTHYIKGFKAYLQLEKSLSANSIQGYLDDVSKLFQYFENEKIIVENAQLKNLTSFVHTLYDLGLSPTSQARIISGIRSFYKYLKIEQIIKENPAELLDLPKFSRKLPEVLNIKDIDLLLSSIDLSKPEGERNKAILEVLYSCGLRVSELIELKISDLFLEDKFIKVIGKGNKERFVPIGSIAIKQLKNYIELVRVHQTIKKGSEDIIFLNKNGSKLSRQMIFIFIKNLAAQCGIKKKISPHTFRHSFATHMIDGGADLRAIQEMLGHSSITTTEIYTHLDRSYLRDMIIQFHPRS